MIVCGTERGYQAHHREDTPYCDPCKAAHARHRAKTRRETETTGQRARLLAGQRAYGAALRALRDAHLSEWDEYRARTDRHRADARLREVHRAEFDGYHADARAAAGLAPSRQSAGASR